VWVTITTTGCLAPAPAGCEGLGEHQAWRHRGRRGVADDCTNEWSGLFHCDADGREYLPFSLTQIAGPHP